MDGLDTRLSGVLKALEADVVAFDLDGATIGWRSPRQALDQRGLACAVVTDDGRNLAGIQVEIDVVSCERHGRCGPQQS